MSALQNFPRITPFLWFDSNAEEAVDFYLSVFRNSRRLDEVRTANDSRAKDPIALPMGCEEDKDKERKWRHLGDRGQNDHDRESRYPLLQQEPESDP